MALRSRSLILWSLEVDETNRSIDFKAVSGGPTILATLRTGFYSLTSLCTEIVRAMQSADPANNYFCTADRTVVGGTQNRVTISTSGIFLSLLFGSGPRAASTVAPLIGFSTADHTGATTYTGFATCGTALIPEQFGYNYARANHKPKVFGAVNKSASGVKQAVVFAIQKFIQVQFKAEPESKVVNEWEPFIQWAIQQRPFDFTPEVSSPNTVYEVTLDSSSGDGKGLGFYMREQIDWVPQFYDTGLMVFMLVPQ